MTGEHSQHPGIVLKRRFLDPLHIAPLELARALGLPIQAVTDLLGGERMLDADMALRLGLFFNVPARWWLEMQARFEADDTQRLAELRSIVTPFAGLADVLVTPVGVMTLDATATESEPPGVQIPAEFEARLRAQTRAAPRRLQREPEVVVHEDGTLTLTGS